MHRTISQSHFLNHLFTRSFLRTSISIFKLVFVYLPHQPLVFLGPKKLSVRPLIWCVAGSLLQAKGVSSLYSDFLCSLTVTTFQRLQLKIHMFLRLLFMVLVKHQIDFWFILRRCYLEKPSSWLSLWPWKSVVVREHVCYEYSCLCFSSPGKT